MEVIGSAIVSDDRIELIKAIDNALNEHSSSLNLILTSGGTGFAPRDITPEVV